MNISKRLLRLPEVMERTGLGKSTIYAWMKIGKFPKNIKLATKIAVWNEAEIEKWELALCK